MGAVQQALLMCGGFVPPPTWVNNTSVASTFSTASGTYVDVLDATAGSPVTVTITVGPGQSVLLALGASWTITATAGITMGAEFDNGIGGVTDYDIDVFSAILNWTGRRGMQKERLITGLAAGTYTVTVRVKTSAGTISLVTGDNVFIRALVF